MGKINVKIAQAHENQMRNFDVQREMKSVKIILTQPNLISILKQSR